MKFVILTLILTIINCSSSSPTKPSVYKIKEPIAKSESITPVTGSWSNSIDTLYLYSNSIWDNGTHKGNYSVTNDTIKFTWSYGLIDYSTKTITQTGFLGIYVFTSKNDSITLTLKQGDQIDSNTLLKLKKI